MKLVKVNYKALNGTERSRIFIKIKKGYIPIDILGHIEELLNIISEKDLIINEINGEIN